MSDILYRITDRFDSLTNSQRVVANYVSENISNVAFNTLDELALKIGVSTTTVIRFARALGYSGYSDMQQDIQSNIKGKVSLPERFSTATSHIKRDQLLLDSFHADIENINQTLASLNESVLRRAVEAIVKANHIYLLGMRGSFSMAHLMATRLGQIKDRVRLIQAVGSIFPEEVGGATQGDLCIVFMFPRYSRMTANIVSALKKRGVLILMFTSQNYTAVKSYGDIILPCAIQGLSYKNSFVAPLCLINYLVTAVSIEDTGAKEVLERTEEMLSQGYYFGL
ncbi:MurR/RpiR family transcriptional regulator [Ruminococcaceae bacterium BL-6]|jgi:DNA-binding MurR/RpiR family transcriptional regulator|nr:MurR/RpiR family transcriptional regulator [Ruminococcaceae bacterium BL-6]HBC26036.1 MurR/RpiR family transcriptional regulator [Oscillospiraceae bacterium]